jgi:hypothetical protein
MMGVTTQLAAFVVDSAGADIPSQAYVRAKEAMRESVQHSKGHPANPLTAVALQDKFEDCAYGVLKRQDLRQVIELVQGLEQVDDIGTLMDVLMA